MEFEDIIKIVWFTIIIIVFVVSRFKSNQKAKQSPPIDEDVQSDDNRRTITFDLEQLLGKVSSPVENKASDVEIEPKRNYQPVETKPVDEITEKEIVVERKESKGQEFDLRKAVIMAEILNPKFKNE